MKPIWSGLPIAAFVVVALSLSPFVGRAAAENVVYPSSTPPADTKKPVEKKSNAKAAKKKTSELSIGRFTAG